MASITVTSPSPDQVFWARDPNGMLSIRVTGTAKSTIRRTPTREIESTVVAVRARQRITSRFVSGHLYTCCGWWYYMR